MTAATAHLADSQHPWIGLASFTEDEREFFAGRGEEIDELLRLVRRDVLTLLYGVSGLGKTSLLQAGLFPALRVEDYLPVPIRLDYLKGAAPLAAQVLGAIIAAADAARVEAPQPGPDETLWEYLHREGNHFWSSHNDLVTPLLAFDQFEELFTIGRETPECAARTIAFIGELADLVENRAPAALRDDPSRAKEFSFKPAPLKVLLAMREDYLADLDRVRSHFRALGQNRLRLLPMGERQARQVIVLGAPLLAPGVEDRILKFVAGGDDDAEMTIAPALLSLVLRELNERRLESGLGAKITGDLLDVEQQKIFEDFYLRTIQDFPVGVRTFIEDKLLTTSGYRGSCALDDALSCPDVTQPILNELVNRRLLAYEDRHHTRRVELTHDVLIPVIKASRDTRHEREALAQAEQQQREACHKARVARRRLAVVTVLLVFAVAAAIYGWSQCELARKQKAAAEEQARILDFERQAAANTPGSADRTILFACQLAKDLGNRKNSIDPLLYGDIISVLDRALDNRGRLVETHWNFQFPAAKKVLGDRFPVSAVAYSPDGRTLAIGDSEARVRFLRNSILSDPVPIPGQLIWTLAFSPDGSRVAVGTDRGFVSIFDPDESAPAHNVVELPFPGASDEVPKIWSCSWNERGDLAAAGQDGKIYLWSDLLDAIKSGPPPLPVCLENGVKPNLIPVHAVAWDRASSMLAMGDAVGNLRIWNRATLSEPTKAHSDAIWSLAWSQDGRLACGSWDHSISIWKIETAIKGSMPSLLNRKEQAHDQRVRDVVWIDNDQGIASVGDDGMLKFWRSSDLSPFASEQSHTTTVWRVSYSPSTKMIATGNHDGAVRIFQLTPPRQQQDNYGNNVEPVIRLAFSDSKVLSFDSEGRVDRFDPISRTEERKIQIQSEFQSGIVAVGFQPQLKAFVIGYDNRYKNELSGTLAVWNPSSDLSVTSCKTKEAIRSIDCPPTKSIVAFLTKPGTLGLRTLPDLQPVSGQPDLPLIQKPEGRIARGMVAWSHSGNTLLVALVHSDDNGESSSEIRPFHFNDEALTAVSPILFGPGQISSMLWDPGDQVIAIGTTNGAIVLHSLTGLQTDPIFAHDSAVTTLGWSIDGRRLFTGGADGSVKVWDYNPDGKDKLTLAITLRHDTGGIRAIAVAPDGMGIYTAGESPRIFHWPEASYSMANIFDRARKMVNRNMLGAEWARYAQSNPGEQRPYEKTFDDLPALSQSE
jgi:WD40 repeat protein